ncbi:hypothetical protein HYN48_14545 [Flavobacterium magnum]|uniref:Transcription elongation factor n=1 Tax=Flavobacterium magnum TaxID=2162713 RepID=A0A2S0RHS4_9FLAO|nr:hypothetical protein [Flavobacterium magnum]AWA31216.1 hypothetical protein HYN48_14545 [Flavobacterium magnum]
MIPKAKIHLYYSQLVQDKIDAFRDMIAALTEDSKNDAKGSAGDKHETALSMMHIEQEKLSAKLSEFLAQKAVLDKIDPLSVNTRAVVGSLVQTNRMLVYIAAALPKINIEGNDVFAISPQSPLGSQLMGHEAGYSFDINGTAYRIEHIR